MTLRTIDDNPPKDGTYVILFSAAETGAAFPRQCSWWSGERCAALHGGEPEDYEAGWYIEDTYDEFCRPTHWMPLPSQFGSKGSPK